VSLIGVLGLFVFLVTLSVFIFVVARENNQRRMEILRKMREESAPPAGPEGGGTRPAEERTSGERVGLLR
jgi:hypothetical protein